MEAAPKLPPAFACALDDLHPFACDGPGKCVHCDRRETPGHDPEACTLCAGDEAGPQ